MKSLLEFFGLREGPFDDLNRQLGQAQSLRGGPRTEPSVRRNQDRASRWTPSTAKAQSDLDSSQSVVKREASGLGMQVHFTNQELDRIRDWATEDEGDPMADAILKKVIDVGRNGGDLPRSGQIDQSSDSHPGSLLQISPRLKP